MCVCIGGMCMCMWSLHRRKCSTSVYVIYLNGKYYIMNIWETNKSSLCLSLITIRYHNLTPSYNCNSPNLTPSLLFKKLLIVLLHHHTFIFCLLKCQSLIFSFTNKISIFITKANPQTQCSKILLIFCLII